MSAVLVTGLTLKVDEGALREFFSYSGEVSSVELMDSEGNRSAIVSFTDASALATALLLTGSTIVADDPPITVVASYKPGESAAAAEEPDLVDLERVKEALAGLMARGFLLGKDAVAKAKALDEQAGVSARVKETAEQVSARLKLAETRSALSAYGSAAHSAAQAHAQALAAKAKELNEKHQLGARARTMASDVQTSVSGALDKAGPPGEALKSAAAGARSLFARAAGGAGDLMAAAKAKVDALAVQQQQAEKAEKAQEAPAAQ